MNLGIAFSFSKVIRIFASFRSRATFLVSKGFSFHDLTTIQRESLASVDESALSVQILQPEKKQSNIRLRNGERHSSVLETLLKHCHWLPHCLVYKANVRPVRALELKAFQTGPYRPITLV